ncbi:hypothetical protein GCM10009721_21020 [Terrabacter tumescens]|uniref:Uncharacterized protein n=1 Tax=Terrabacter tumescens TaxID=60443 RepID=A0ABQ2HZL2_9MICO|nr:hypothetical protein GCM10009721_21020 [Terrabacter tumescens]
MSAEVGGQVADGRGPTRDLTVRDRREHPAPRGGQLWERHGATDAVDRVDRVDRVYRRGRALGAGPVWRGPRARSIFHMASVINSLPIRTEETS